MNKMLRSKFLYSKINYDANKAVLETYNKTKTDEEELLTALLDDMVSSRNDRYGELYSSINSFMQGEILKADAIAFPLDVGNSDALTIMNTKASIFDVNSLYVELRAATVNDNDNKDERSETFIDQFNRILNESYLAKPQYKFTIADAIKYSRAYPIAITLIGWDDNAVLGANTNFKGDVVCENIPLNDFYWDPAANNIDNCEYVMITKLLSYAQIYNFINKIKDKNLELLDAYAYTASCESATNNSTDTLVDNQTLINSGALELKVFYQKEHNNSNTKIKVSYVVGDGYIIATQVIDIPYLPFAILKEHAMPSAFTGISSVMLAMPYIKQKAVIDGVCNNIAMMQKDPRYIIDSAAGIDVEEFLNFDGTSSGKAFTIYGGSNPNTAVALVPSPQIQPDLFRWKEQIQAEINTAIGASDANNFGSKLSGSAVQNIVDQNTIKENTSIVELERYITRFVQIVLQFLKLKLPKMKQDTLSFRSASKDKTTDDNYSIYEITPDEFTKLDADVIVDASLLRTSKKQKQLQDLLQVYQMQLQYMGDNDNLTLIDIIDSLNIQNKQEIINRIKTHNENTELQKSIALVQGVIQLMQMPEFANMDIQQATATVLENLKGGNK